MNNFQIKIIERAIDNDEKLSSWEHDFIYSLDSIPQHQDLTEKQNHILNKISEKL